MNAWRRAPRQWKRCGIWLTPAAALFIIMDARAFNIARHARLIRGCNTPLYLTTTPRRATSCVVRVTCNRHNNATSYDVTAAYWLFFLLLPRLCRIYIIYLLLYSAHYAMMATAAATRWRFGCAARTLAPMLVLYRNSSSSAAAAAFRRGF